MRKAVVALLVLGLCVSMAWIAAWFAASAYAARQVDVFIAQEAGQGRTWTCPKKAVGGFPFALAITCSEPSYAGAAMGQVVRGQVAGLVATLSLSHLTRIDIALAPPFSYASDDAAISVEGTWGGLTFALSALPDLRTLSLHGTDVAVHGRFPGRDETGGSAKMLDASFTASPPQPNRTLDFTVAMSGAPVAVVDDLLGGSAPIDATIIGQLDQADAGEARTPAAAMEYWRRNGGKVALASLEISRERSSALASGPLDLDEKHRLRGRLDASFVGLEPILERYGISGQTAAIGALIGNLFGGGRPAKAAAPGALSLPINLANGRLAIGPLQTSLALSPLY